MVLSENEIVTPNDDSKKPTDTKEKADQSFLDGKITHLEFLQHKIDRDIGYNYWKKYTAAAFWSQISTPINLTITFLTAITTAQANSQNLISESLFGNLAIISLVITTLNTFFRPHTQLSQNKEYLQKWNDAGIKFEKEYYKKIFVHDGTLLELNNIETKITSYESIQEEINNIRKSEGAGTVNFVTDLIFLIAYSTCIRGYKCWLDLDLKIEEETKDVIEAKEKKRQEDRIMKDRYESHYRIAQLKIQQEEEEELRKLGLQPTDITYPDKPMIMVGGHNDIEMARPRITPPPSPRPFLMLRKTLTEDA